MELNIKTTGNYIKISEQQEYLNILVKYNLKTTLGGYRDEICTIEINTLKELIQLQKELNIPLIIENEIIEIYDDWRE